MPDTRFPTHEELLASGAVWDGKDGYDFSGTTTVKLVKDIPLLMPVFEDPGDWAEQRYKKD